MNRQLFRLRNLAFATIALGLSAPAQAWNDMGHMTVAAVAWSQMTDTARREASRLLKLNPHYQDWIRAVPAGKRDEVAFLRAATWPDKIRGEYEDDGYEPVEPRASQNIGYADRLIHPYWHYKNLPFSADSTPVEDADAVNAVSRIEVFRDALAARDATDSVKSYDLSWLIHLVGDIHQPLHATARFTSDFRHGDRGGNSVKVCAVTASHCGTNDSLHSFWDGGIGNSKSANVALAKAKQLRPADRVEADVSDPNRWAAESSELAKTYAYAAPVGRGKGPYRLTARYSAKAGSVAEQRIALAGARLANILNDAWK